MRYLLLFVFILSVSETHAVELSQQSAVGCRLAADDNRSLEIICNGVPPKALKRLNGLLNLNEELYEPNSLGLQGKIEKAQQWSRIYIELNHLLGTLGTETEDALVVKKLLEEGNFIEAGLRHDRIMDKKETDPERAASTTFRLASLGFN